MSAAGWVLGLHLLTLHTAPGFNSDTAGVYVTAPCGISAGVLRNSLGRQSVYVGYSLSAGPVSLTLGGITGYPARAVRPLLLPSVRVPIGGSSAVRLTFIPRVPRFGSQQAFHLSIESAF